MFTLTLVGLLCAQGGAPEPDLVELNVQLKCSEREKYVDRFCSLAQLGADSCTRLHERAKGVCQRRGHQSEQLWIPVRHLAMVTFPVVVDGETHEMRMHVASDAAVASQAFCGRTGLSATDCAKVERELTERQAKLTTGLKELRKPKVEELQMVDGVHAAVVNRLASDVTSASVCDVQHEARDSENGSTPDLLLPGVRVVAGEAARFRDLRLKVCRHGLMLFPSKEAVGQSLNLFGEWDEECVTDVFQLFVRPGDVVMDVGAHIGSYTLVFAKAVAPLGRVIAVEPQRIIQQTLTANIALNGLDNVWPILGAAGSRRQAWRGRQKDSPHLLLGHHVPLEAGMFGVGSFQHIAGGLGRFNETVPHLTLDEILLHHDHDGNIGFNDQAVGGEKCRLRFIKVDVEGLEMEVLDGALRALAMCRPLLYLEYNGHGPKVADALDSGAEDMHADEELPPPVSKMPLISFLRKKLKYRVYAHQFHTRLARELKDDYVESNILAVPAEHSAENDICENKFDEVDRVTQTTKSGA